MKREDIGDQSYAEFKEYQRGTIEGVEVLRDVLNAIAPDDAIITGAQLKALLTDYVNRLIFERDEWERTRGI